MRAGSRLAAHAGTARAEAAEAAAQELLARPALALDRWLGKAAEGLGAGVLVVVRDAPLAALLREWWILARRFAPAGPDEEGSGSFPTASMVPWAGGGVELTAARHGGERGALDPDAVAEAYALAAFDVYVAAGMPAAVAAAAVVPLVRHRLIDYANGPRTSSNRACKTRVPLVQSMGAVERSVLGVGRAGQALSLTSPTPSRECRPRVCLVVLPGAVDSITAAPASSNVDCIVVDVLMAVPTGATVWNPEEDPAADAAAGYDDGYAQNAEHLLASTLAFSCDTLRLRVPYLHSLNASGVLAHRQIKVVDLSAAIRLVRLGPLAFAHCLALEELILPPSLEIVGNGFCRGCESLQRVHVYGLGERPLRFLSHAFQRCHQLAAKCVTDPPLPRNCTVVPRQFMYGVNGFKVCLAPLTSLTSIRKRFLMGAVMGQIDWPPQLRWIGSQALFQARFPALVTIDLRKLTRLIEIGSRVFNHCVGLQKVLLPASIRRIGDDFCAHSLDMKELDLTEAQLLTSIGVRLCVKSERWRRVNPSVCLIQVTKSSTTARLVTQVIADLPFWATPRIVEIEKQPPEPRPSSVGDSAPKRPTQKNRGPRQ